MQRNSKKGFSLLTMAVLIPVMVAMLGLAVDVGRIYIVKNELQTFADAAAAAAAFELDGTSSGISRAQSTAGTGPGSNRYDFGTKVVTSVQSSFAQTLSGTYVANPLLATNYRFVKVTVSADSPVYFLTIFPNISNSRTISASSVAGQGMESSIGEGVGPFSPDAHNPSDPNFGFIPGIRYTIKWAPPGQRNKPGGRCPGDLIFNPGGGSSDRGYIDVGQGNGNSALHDAIVNNDYNLAQPLTVGSPIDMVPGNKHVGPAVNTRFNQDTDTTSITYATYNGNGRRLMVLPVNDGANNARVVGFGAFLLHSDSCSTNQKPCCAEYVGPGVLNGTRKAAGGPGLYSVKLFQ